MFSRKISNLAIFWLIRVALEIIADLGGVKMTSSARAITRRRDGLVVDMVHEWTTLACNATVDVDGHLDALTVGRRAGNDFGKDTITICAWHVAEGPGTGRIVGDHGGSICGDCSVDARREGGSG